MLGALALQKPLLEVGRSAHLQQLRGVLGPKSMFDGRVNTCLTALLCNGRLTGWLREILASLTSMAGETTPRCLSEHSLHWAPCQ